MLDFRLGLSRALHDQRLQYQKSLMARPMRPSRVRFVAAALLRSATGAQKVAVADLHGLDPAIFLLPTIRSSS